MNHCANPPWVVMWIFAISIYFVCKCATWWRTSAGHVPVWRHAAYLLAWPGLDAANFLSGMTISARSTSYRNEAFMAARRLVLGLILFFGIARRIPGHLLLGR